MTNRILIGAAVIGIGFIPFTIGFNMAEREYQKIAIQEECAFFHPDTARFTWINQALEE